MQTQRSTSGGVVAVVALAGIVPVLLWCLLARFVHVQMASLPLHTAVEMAGSCGALGVAALLWMRLRDEMAPRYMLWSCAALLALGVFDGFHGIMTGPASGWARCLATFSGGILYACGWVPVSAASFRHRRALMGTLALVCVATVTVLGFLSPRLVPPWSTDGYFALAGVMNGLGALGFVAGAILFFRRCSNEREPEAVYFAGHTLLFGVVAVLLYFLREPWTMEWWLWHALRVVCILIVAKAESNIIARQNWALRHQKHELAAEVQRRTEALRGSEQRFELAARATQDAIWDWDLRTNSVWWNDAVRRSFGYKEEQISELNWWIDLLHPDDRPRVLEGVSRALASGASVWRDEYRFLRADGKYANILDRGYILREADGTAIRMIGAMLDCTDRMLAQDLMRRQACRQELLSRFLAALLGARDPEAVVSSMVPAVAAEVGVDIWLGYLVAEDASALKLHACGGLTAEQELEFAVLRMGESLCGHCATAGQMLLLHDVQTSDNTRAEPLKRLGARAYVCHPLLVGNKVLGTLTFVSIHRDQFDMDDVQFLGAVSRCVAVAMDRARAEKALSAAHEQLSSHARKLDIIVDQRTVELRETVQQLETFSYSIVHDMRAPLRSMQSFAGILEEEYGEQLDDTGRDYIARIVKSSRRLDGLITDVLAYSRLGADGVAPGVVNLDRLVPEIVEHYPQFHSHAERIQVIAPLGRVQGNPALLTQVISNLLGNALKFVPPGTAPRVTVRGTNHGSFVRVSVEDNGIGIGAEHQNKIFGLFQRLHHDHQYPGTGVGLAIVKKAVEKMGGKVGVSSVPGEGARFWFELPAAEGAPVVQSTCALQSSGGSEAAACRN